MARVLDARAAADEIRGKLEAPSPQDRHVADFVGKVLDQLGMEHNIVNASMMVHALHNADIQPHVIQEYPKAVTIKVVNEAKYGDDKEHAETTIVDNEDEEHELLMGKAPPADLAPEPAVEPVADDAKPSETKAEPAADDHSSDKSRPGPRPAPKRMA